MNETDLIHASAKYINWNTEAQRITVSHDRFNELVAFFRTHGREITESKTIRMHWLEDNSYHIDSKGAWQTIYAAYHDGHELVIYSTCLDDDKNPGKRSFGGSRAFTVVNNMLIDQYGMSFKSIYGTVSPDFKRYIPSAIIWLSDRFAHRTVRHVYKADYSAAYPYQLCHSLPDAHKSAIKNLKGRVAPTKEYPFAFYPGSCTMAIYGEFDSKNYTDHFFGDRFPAKKCAAEDETTILMKAATRSMRDVMEELYLSRTFDEDAKLTMNSFIGFLHSVNFNKFNFAAHVAAVVLTRHLIRMIKLYDELVDEDNTPFMIATDSVSWVGNPSELTTKSKIIGSLVSEYEDVKLYAVSNGVYAIEREDGTIVSVKHQGIQNFPSDRIKRLSDMEHVLECETEYFDSESSTFKKATGIVYGEEDHN